MVHHSQSPLYSSSYGEGEDTKFKDLLLKQWRGQHGKERKPAIPLKAFRSISKTALDGHAVHRAWGDHFLGHTPKTVGEKNYTADSDRRQGLFDDAMNWLRTEVLGV